MSNDWDKLIFGSYNRAEINQAVDDAWWQTIRGNLRGTSLDERFRELQRYLRYAGFSREAKIRVTNYVNALKRGGMIK